MPLLPVRRKLRVLHVVEASVGGVRTYLLHLFGHLSDYGIESEVACPSVRIGPEAVDHSFVEDARRAGVLTHIVEMRREVSPLHDLHAFFKIQQVLAGRRFHIVHGHSSKGGFLGRLAGKLHGLPTVYTPNGFHFLGLDHQLSRSAFVGLERIAGKVTDRLIAVSQSEAEVARNARIVAATKLSVIPNGVNVVELGQRAERRAALRASCGISQNAKVITTVARLSQQKDPRTLIQAIARLNRPERERIVCLWCGAGPLREDVLNFARQLGVSEHVRLLGVRQDIPDILLASDVFVLASLYEGLPFALLEAMATGVPVVATDVVGNRDVVIDRHNGRLISAGSPEMLADAIEELLTNAPLASAYAARAVSYVERHFSVSAMARATAEIYFSLACV